MAFNTFHPFPRLPTELRMQIWEAACRGLRQSFQAVHYVTLDEYTEMSPLKHNWDDSKPRNKSIYLWDAGLWTACQESRDVVAKHWGKQPRPYNDDDMLDCCSLEEYNHYDRIWPEEDSGRRVLMLHSRVDGEHWRQMVYPKYDLLCIVADDWEFLTSKWTEVSYWGIVLDAHNVAVEFDPSWNLSLENKTSTPFIEDVPASLEFLLRWLFGHIGNDGSPKPKLIVRDMDWILRHHINGPQIRDFDEEYVEVPAYELVPYISSGGDTTSIARDSTLSDFFDLLDQVYYEKSLEIYCYETFLDPCDWDYEIETSSHRLDIRDSFSILLSRTNQVER
ncbi:unnamed protein product [Fusarium graminearum]|uniref:Chromosome 3, complete genome n=1 Tax=Gibberella zeae (strain ATCC MYA-4620 / CBS 123657 / FGSC 9075 / NRRL 31084 / PH-1) TaxID=229533 RepID=A0A098E3Q2_GIBZE|nr:unnamed protein product [Fusarium graminearum]